MCKKKKYIFYAKPAARCSSLKKGANLHLEKTLLLHWIITTKTFFENENFPASGKLELHQV